MKVSDYIARSLHAQGVTHVFELIGGMITLLIDAIDRAGQVEIVSVHHEQGASFAADAIGRVTGVPGVALATSGPGATNLLTGIGSCYFDSSPAVFLTGQVNTFEQKGQRAIRQLGFQETDIVAMAKPITKWAYLVKTAAEVPEVLDRAFATAISGRPGPVLIDIPMDIQKAEIEAQPPRRVGPERAGGGDPAFVAELLDRLASARRPLILAGGGVQSGRSVEVFRAVVDRLGVPVINSLLGTDVLPYDHPSRVGMIGSYGNRWANLAIDRSDLILVLGSRLDVRQTGSEVKAFRADRAIFHVDCEPGELNNRITGCRALTSELSEFLPALLRATEGWHTPDYSPWIAEIAESRRARPDIEELKGRIKGINPNVFMHQLSSRSGAASAYVVDVGQHQMWAAQSLELRGDQRFLTSGGMGAMGFALPAALGAALARPGRPVVLIAGDGGFQLNLQELQTVVRNRLPIKMVVLNNLCHGMVRQFQEDYFKARYRSTFEGYSTPDFAAVAGAYGIPSRQAAKPEDVPASLDALWADPESPSLLEVMIDTFTNAFPKLAFGLPISQMQPDAKPLEMEGT